MSKRSPESPSQMTKKFLKVSDPETSNVPPPPLELVSDPKSTTILDDFMALVESNQLDLSELFKKKGFRTPPILSMSKEPNALKETILENICCQGYLLSPSTIMKLYEFFNMDFLIPHINIYLQALVIISKIDAQLCLDRAKKSGLSAAAVYNNVLKNYCMNAMEQHAQEDVVMEADKPFETFIKNQLRKTPIILSIKAALKVIFKEDIYTDQQLKDKINDLKIYVTNQFQPLNSLHGVCLVDGFLLCKKKINNRFGTNDIYDSHRTTLAAHEFTHFLVRLHLNNFNFSTPYKNVLEADSLPRMDTVIPDYKLETGRTTEVFLFPGCQVQWGAATLNAARTFLARLDERETLPIVTKKEFSDKGFAMRETPSLHFGIDIDDFFVIE